MAAAGRLKGAAVILLLGFLVMLPFVALRDVMRLVAAWRRVPLQQKNHIRSTWGGFLLVLSIGLAVRRFPAADPIELYVLGGLGAIGLLYLVVGIHGAPGARFDFMSGFWWAVTAIGCAAALVLFQGISV